MAKVMKTKLDVPLTGTAVPTRPRPVHMRPPRMGKVPKRVKKGRF